MRSAKKEKLGRMNKKKQLFQSIHLQVEANGQKHLLQSKSNCSNSDE